MGVCQSCLGRDRRDSENDEDAGLLYQDANGMQYGSFVDQSLNGDLETTEAQRENEEIQNVVAKMSENMVDVFEVSAPARTRRGSATNFAYGGQGARLARYQHLVSRLSAEEADAQAGGVKVGWLADDDDGADLAGTSPVSLKTQEGGDGALVGTFADAAAAANTGTTSTMKSITATTETI